LPKLAVIPSQAHYLKSRLLFTLSLARCRSNWPLWLRYFSHSQTPS